MKKFRQTLYPTLAAMIWGAAFSAQSVCAKYLHPFSINALRSVIAFLVLLTVCLLRRRRLHLKWRDLIIGSICCGTALFAAANVQQFGISGGASAGKAGFITALYIVLVPLAGVFMGKKITGRLWLAIAVAIVGMYFLCISQSFSITSSDIYLLLCAVFFAVQILAVDHFAKQTDGLVLSCGQFFVMSLLSAVCMLVFETTAVSDIANCMWALLYVGVISSCLGYTLQILAQKEGNPTLVSLLMSLEALFSAFFGALLLNEHLSERELIGCGLMIAAILLAELPAKKRIFRS